MWTDRLAAICCYEAGPCGYGLQRELEATVKKRNVA